MDKAWYGKMPPAHCAPLTLQWFRSVTNPRAVCRDHGELHGAKIYSLTPPRERYGRAKPVRWQGAVALLGVLIIVAFWMGAAAMKP